MSGRRWEGETRRILPERVIPHQKCAYFGALPLSFRLLLPPFWLRTPFYSSLFLSFFPSWRQRQSDEDGRRAKADAAPLPGTNLLHIIIIISSAYNCIVLCTLCLSTVALQTRSLLGRRAITKKHTVELVGRGFVPRNTMMERLLPLSSAAETMISMTPFWLRVQQSRRPKQSSL